VSIGQTSDDPKFDLPVPWDPVGGNNTADVRIRTTG
jgi:hypothetical protein